jgi:capsular polysaccharide transport system permease protein
MKKLFKDKTFMTLVALPVAVATLYFGVIAEPVFETEAQVSLKSVTTATTQSGPLAMLGMSNPGREETHNLQAHLQSSYMAETLDQAVGLKKVWAAPGRDKPARLSSSASREEFLAYYNANVLITFDDLSGSLVIKAKSFDPAHTKSIVDALIKQGDVFVNNLSQAMVADQLAFVTGQTEKAYTDVQAARLEMQAFQSKHGLYDSEAEARSGTELVAKLEAELAGAETELSAASAYLSPESYQRIGLQQRADSLRSQVARQRAKISKSGSPVAAEFKVLGNKLAFLEEIYKRALEAEQTVRLEAARKAKTLAVVVPAHLPEEASYPRRPKNIVLTLFAALGLFLSVRLARAVMLENRK